jgi:hypothetical protein
MLRVPGICFVAMKASLMAFVMAGRAAIAARVVPAIHVFGLAYD